MANGYCITNKTEFMRYLDDHEDLIPELESRIKSYRSLRVKRHHFGFWLRWKYLKEFNHAYNNWWLKRPELFDKNQPQETTIQS